MDINSTQAYKATAPSHLPRMISISFTGEVSSSSMVPVFFSSAINRMVIIGIRNSDTVLAKPSSGRMIISFRLTGCDWPII